MMQGQSRRDSVLEASVNIGVGYLVAVAAQRAIFPLFGIHTSPSEDVLIAGMFTVISWTRSFALRRAFNWCQMRRPPVATQWTSGS